MSRFASFAALAVLACACTSVLGDDFDFTPVAAGPGGAGNGGTGGAAGAGAGGGGTSAGTGGAGAGAGGAAGSSAGSGGSGAGGASAGAGGSGAGAGGASAGAGGGNAGSGGAGAAGAGGSGGSGGIAAGAGGNAGAMAGGAGSGGTGAPVCGDGVKAPSEDCDGTDLGGASCFKQFPNKDAFGTVKCTGCKLDFSGCNYCGDGTIAPNEECDTTSQYTCVDLLGDNYSNKPGCTALGDPLGACKIDLSKCKPLGAFQGPSLASVPVAAAGSTVGIDSTEVTVGQYTAFLAATGGAPPQSAACKSNDVKPSAGCLSTLECKGGIGCYKLPMECVDWCDAETYCTWAGKGLCGLAVGGHSIGQDLIDATKDTWYAACTSGGAHTYPYGNTYDNNACNGFEAKGGHVAPVASFPLCHGTGQFSGVLDLAGNVQEWVDSCTQYADTTGIDCVTRGGNFKNAVGSDMFTRCDGTVGTPRESAFPGMGFRCCSLPGPF